MFITKDRANWTEEDNATVRAAVETLLSDWFWGGFQPSAEIESLLREAYARGMGEGARQVVDAWKTSIEAMEKM